MSQFYLHHRIEFNHGNPIIIHREFIGIAGLVAADMVSRRVRINRSIKSEPHGVSLIRQKQRGVSITEYHGTKLMRVYTN